MNGFTVYEQVHAGKRANEARDKINEVLDEAHIPLLVRIAVLDLMAMELKVKAVKE